MPSGLTHSCPFEEGSSLPAQSGSLSGYAFLMAVGALLVIYLVVFAS